MREHRARKTRSACSNAGALARAFAMVMLSACPGAVIPATVALAQSQSLASAQRVIGGKVLNADGAAQQGAIVYLKNTKTLEIRTYISTADGSYRFGQLGMDSDFTLWADLNGKKSKEKTISSFDSRKTVDINLKLEAGK